MSELFRPQLDQSIAFPEQPNVPQYHETNNALQNRYPFTLRHVGHATYMLT